MAQRRPWLTSVLVAFVVAGLGGPWAWRWYPIREDCAWTSAMSAVPAGFAFLSHVGRGGRAPSDRLAPLLAANLAVLGLAAGLVATHAWQLSWGPAVGYAMALVVWPLVCAALLPGSPPGDATPIAAVAFTTTLLLLPPLTVLVFHAPDAWIFPASLNLLLVPLAFHALVRSRQPSGWIVGLAGALGIAWSLLLPADRSGQASPTRALVAPVAWLVAGLFVVAARRCRSMTAVPRDHPLVEDFGGA